jgi:hypothetical protein
MTSCSYCSADVCSHTDVHDREAAPNLSRRQQTPGVDGHAAKARSLDVVDERGELHVGRTRRLDQQQERRRAGCELCDELAPPLDQPSPVPLALAQRVAAVLGRCGSRPPQAPLPQRLRSSSSVCCRPCCGPCWRPRSGACSRGRGRALLGKAEWAALSRRRRLVRPRRAPDRRHAGGVAGELRCARRVRRRGPPGRPDAVDAGTLCVEPAAVAERLNAIRSRDAEGAAQGAR